MNFIIKKKYFNPSQVAVAILQAVQMIQVIGRQILDQMKIPSANYLTLVRGVQFTHVLFNICIFYSLNIKSAACKEKLLRELQKLELRLAADESKEPQDLLEPSKVSLCTKALKDEDG